MMVTNLKLPCLQTSKYRVVGSGFGIEIWDRDLGSGFEIGIRDPDLGSEYRIYGPIFGLVLIQQEKTFLCLCIIRHQPNNPENTDDGRNDESGKHCFRYLL